MNGKGFGFGSRTREVHNKTMRWREIGYSGEYDEDIDRDRKYLECHSGLLVASGSRIYLCKRGDSGDFSVMSKMNVDDRSIGSLTVHNGDVYHIGDSVPTNTITGEKVYRDHLENNIFMSICSHKGSLIGGGPSVMNIDTGKYLRGHIRGVNTVCVGWDDRLIIGCDDGLYLGITRPTKLSNKKIIDTAFGDNTLEENVLFYATDRDIRLFYMNDHVICDRSGVNSVCLFDKTLYDGGVDGKLYDSNDAHKEHPLMSFENPITSMISISGEPLLRFFDATMNHQTSVDNIKKSGDKK
jgi:hypothetical protein